MKITFITMLALIIFSTTECSKTKSQSNDTNKPAIQIATKDDGRPQPIKSPPIEAESIKEWRGKVGSNYFHWDGKELNIKLANGRNIKTFSEFAKGAFREQVKDEPETKDCETSFYYRPLAIVDNLVTFQAEWGLLCGAINTYSGTYATIELAKDRKFLFHRPVAGDPKSYEGDVYLSSMFSENDIFKALLTNEQISSDVSKLISQGKIDRQPKNLAELKKLFDKFKYDFLNGEFYLDSDSLKDFAIHHLEDDKVSVWVSLTPSSRSSQLVHLELLLPIPEKIRQSLRLADSREEGFLMKDAKDLVGTSHAKFEFGGKDEY
jgi:hypothetical protein